MRVKITVYGDDFGDVEVEQAARFRTLSGDVREELGPVLDEAVEKIRRAYGIEKPFALRGDLAPTGAPGDPEVDREFDVIIPTVDRGY